MNFIAKINDMTRVVLFYISMNETYKYFEVFMMIVIVVGVETKKEKVFLGQQCVCVCVYLKKKI